MRAARYFAEYFAFRTLACVVDCLGPRTTASLARTMAWMLVTFLPAKVTRSHVAHENLRRAFGEHLTRRELNRLTYEMWVHLFRMVAEVIQAPRRLHLHSYRRVIGFANLAESNEPLMSGRRFLMLGGHFGNWEVGISVFGLWGLALGVIARTLDNPHLNQWFREYREATGHRLLAKKGDFDDLLTLLEQGGNVALLGDQDAGSRGLFVDFFGTPASTFKSIALLATQFDAVILVGGSRRLPDDFERSPWVRFSFETTGIIDPRDYQTADAIRRMTADYTSAIERTVRLAPEQYFWVHRRWKSVPRASRKAAA